MTPADCMNRYVSNLVLRQVQEAEGELPVQMLASTYVAEEDRVRDSAQPGPKIMTFARLLKYSSYPLAGILVITSYSIHYTKLYETIGLHFSIAS